MYSVRADEASEANCMISTKTKEYFFARHLCIRLMHWLSKGVETIFAMENSREENIRNVSLGRSSLFTVFLVLDLHSWQCAKLMGSRAGLVKKLERR